MGEKVYRKLFSGEFGKWLLTSGCYLEVSVISIRGEERYNRVVELKKGLVCVMFYNEHYPMKGEYVLPGDVDWYQPINPEAFLRKSFDKNFRLDNFSFGVVVHFIVGLVFIKCEKLAKWQIKKK